jgi:hypothetical protein
MRTVLFASVLTLSLALAGAGSAAAGGAGGRHMTHYTFQSYGKDSFKLGGPKETGCVPARKVTFDTGKPSKRNLPPCPPKH